MTNSFRNLILWVMLAISIVASGFSVLLFVKMNKLQNLVGTINVAQSNQSNDQRHPVYTTLSINPQDYEYLFWDSEATYTLASLLYSQAVSSENKGLRLAGLSATEELLRTALNFSPSSIEAKLLSLSILIDYGAPLAYFLPKLDELIRLVPKDQDIKAEIARLCFQLAAIYTDSPNRQDLIERLSGLFTHSMDYRGLARIKRYANLLGQEALLRNVYADVQQ